MFKKSTAAQHHIKFALVATIVTAAFSSAPVYASNAATATATANVVLPISITKNKDLVFGQFVAGASGDVTVDTAGARTANGATLVGGVTPQAAKFTITGANNAGYSIDYSSSDPSITNGTDTMALTLYSDNNAGGIATGTPLATDTLDGTGTQTLYVGGKLTVAGTESPGAYTGNINITVTYQ